MNEGFTPLGVGIDTPNYTLSIYDRWGELIFEDSGYPVTWDGTLKGEIVQNDVYIWRVWLRDINGIAYQFQGHISVLK